MVVEIMFLFAGTHFLGSNRLKVMQFTEREIELAVELKNQGLAWEPQPGNYIFDMTHALVPGSPFQDQVYFILDLDCFLRVVGGLEPFKRLMVWVPIWEECRDIMQSFAISDELLEAEIYGSRAIEAQAELVRVYRVIGEQLKDRQ